MYIIAMFFAPVFSVITSACTVGALVLVGLMMIKAVKDIEWTDPVYLATAFTTIFMMGLAGSITDGIAFGCIVYLAGMAVTRRLSEVSKVMSVIGLIFIVYFVIRYFVTPFL